MRKLILGFVAILLFTALGAAPAFAAISFDNAGSGGTFSGTGPFTWSYHVGSGSNRILFCNAFGGDGLDVVSGITYNGTSMTFVAKVKGSVNHYSYLYELTAPATGTNTVSIAYSGNHFMTGGCASYFGASQSSQPDASTTNTGSGTSLTTTLTTIADNAWTFLVGANNVGSNTAGSGSTARTNTGISWDLFDSNGPIHPAGSTSMTFNPASVSALSSIMISFSPAVTVATATDALMFAGD